VKIGENPYFQYFEENREKLLFSKFGRK